MKFKEGALAKHTDPSIPELYEVPVRVEDAQIEIYGIQVDCYRITFFRKIPLASGGIILTDTMYTAEPEQLSPCTQQDVDNWILEQELTS